MSSHSLSTPSSTARPTIVFVPGAWHQPSCFAPTVALLSQAGYSCTCVALPSVGSETRGEAAPQSWDPDVAAIRSSLLEHIKRGEAVVLVLHSYSGTVGSEAAKGLSKKDREKEGQQGGIVSLVYLTALVLDIGHWVWEATGGKPIPETAIIEV
jgi:pimeloyl-ACP methyl ester carboxylesterase